jgi:redox-sensitive bicupin YhaK (pirin superfamily)
MRDYGRANFSRHYSWVLDACRWYYAYVVKGRASLGGHEVIEGDSVIFKGESSLTIESPESLEVIVFDLRAADK